MRRPTRLSVAAKSAAMMSRSHRARAVRPAESPAEDLRATHDAWTRDLRDRLPHDSDSAASRVSPEQHDDSSSAAAAPIARHKR